MLIAVSSPWASEKLASPLADLASRLKAHVVVAHVTQVQPDDETESDARQRGEQTLKLLREALTAQDIENEAVMLFSNDIAKAIINTAHAKDCTLIVLGINTKGILKRLLDGDVPSRILKQSEIPVLLCPANWVGKI